MSKIKFGTDGWRAIIALDYTVDNVKRVAEATALWIRQHGGASAVVGHDCRFGGELFANTTAQILGAHGLKVYMPRGFVSTPMVSLGAVRLQAMLGVVITASHNPPDYNGYKLKSHLGGPLSPSKVSEVEALIPEVCTTEPMPLKDMEAKGLLEYVDLEQMYLNHVAMSFDLEAIKRARIKIGYDAMYGAGQNAMRRLFPDAVLLHCDDNPSFRGQAPEPIHRNLQEFAALIQQTGDIQLGIANDGDADRIGLYDSKGQFVDSHHILLLLLLYLYKYKQQTGKVVITFSVSDKMKKLAELFGLEVEVTAIGFKYIADIMAVEDVLVGGEESGGLAVKGHIPERDGIWIGLMILEFMAKTGKSLSELIQEVYDLVGPFFCDRDDLHILESQKQAIIQACKETPYSRFGDYKVTSLESIDGYKFNLGNESWVMIRPSGTEPVLRVYAQAPTPAEARAILDATRKELGV